MQTSLPKPVMAFQHDFEYCRKVIKEGSKSFHLASLLLPKPVRLAAFAIYAFCRVADDAVDLGDDPARAVDLLMRRLDRIYAGAPDDHSIDRAFACVVSNYELPRAFPDALLEGMSWDAEGKRYETLNDLTGYAARVAGTVGAMMTILMGNRSGEAIARASDLGAAMQLTNIARDIGEDARAGRLYLPQSWLIEAGLDEDAFLGAPEFDPRIAHLTQRLLDAAEPMYARGLSGLELLAPRCRTSIKAAGKIYREIGEEVRANNYDSISQRAVVPTRRKLELVKEAMFEPGAPLHTGAALPASVFLVEAVSSTRPRIAYPAVPTGVLWVLDLFARMEVRDKARAAERK